ncbi:hypothetical protein F5Y18DRAFT_390615 [Xylariaceae sp. FL1019]|nr:hypothetical protein F5Y18DRAFT_390615 [Xylariaceae sp. FL1019]
MRFLCFHGKGTNAKIFKQQTEKIRHALGPEHEFVFVDGPLSVKAMKLALDDQNSQDDVEQYLSFDVFNVEQFEGLYRDLNKYIKLSGPFNGVMGFSEGATLAASMIFRQELQLRPDDFKCAVFLSSITPLSIHASVKGELRFLSESIDGTLINLPTAHIWSDADTTPPGVGNVLADLCCPDSRHIVQHSVGHEVPGSYSDQGLMESVRAIERVIEMAKS